MFVDLVFVKEIVVTWYILYFSLPRKFGQNYTMKSPINMYISLLELNREDHSQRKHNSRQ